MDHENLKYLRKRAIKHHEMAQVADDPRVTEKHQELADRYERQLQSEVVSYLRDAEI